MKKISFIIIVSFLFWSCGGGNTSNEKGIKKEKKEVYSLETEDGMLKKLNEFKIDIPESLALAEIKHKSGGGYTAEFKIEEVDDVLKTELFTWYEKQCTDLAEDGWRRKTIYDNDEMMGSIVNQDLFYKDSKSLSMSSNFDIEQNIFKLWLTPDD